MLTERDRNILIWIEEYKVITISQCGSIFFNNSYEGARRRLAQLEKEYGKLKSYILKETDEKVYYIDKKVNYHHILILDYIKTIKSIGGDIIEFHLQPRYMDGGIIPDAFIVFQYMDKIYFNLLEVDLWHNTPLTKMQKYEELYKSEEIQSKYYGMFPILIVAKKTNGLRYNSTNFNIVYVDLSYSNLTSLLFNTIS